MALGASAMPKSSELDHLKPFPSWALPSTVLSSVVAAELAAGARTDRARRALNDAVLAPFDRRDRILAPSVAAWRHTGTVLARTDASPVAASRQNAVLLATQAREHGWVVITRDRDLDASLPMIRGLQVAAPYPE